MVKKNKIALYESFMDSSETLKNIIKRKTKSYKEIFSVDELKSGDDVNFHYYLKLINLALDHLGVNIESEEKDGIKLRDFLSERFNIKEFDWSSIYLKSTLLKLVKQEKIDSEDFKEKIEAINVQPSKFKLKEFRIEDEEDIEPGNLVAWYFDIDDVTFIHYGIFLHHDNKNLVILDFNTNKEGEVKEGEIHIVSVPSERTNAQFLGYYNIFETLEKEEKPKKVIEKSEN
jgi:phage-related protein